VLEARHQVSEVGKVGQDHNGVGPGLVLGGELGKCCGHVAAHHVFEQIDDAGTVGKTEHAAYGFRLHASAAVGDRLVEQRQAVSSGSFGGARDHGKGFRLGGNTLHL